MSYIRWPFAMGVGLHIVFLFTRIRLLDIACIGNGCSSLVFADFPVSVIYFAFSDRLLILFSLVVGSVLWGLWGLAIYRLLRYLFHE